MSKTIKVEIALEGLPDAPNHHALAVAIEDRINVGLALAVADAYPDSFRDIEITSHVPSF